MNATFEWITQLSKAVVLGIAGLLGVIIGLTALLVGAGRVSGAFGVTDPVLVFGLLGIVGLVLVFGFFYYSFTKL